MNSSFACRVAVLSCPALYSEWRISRRCWSIPETTVSSITSVRRARQSWYQDGHQPFSVRTNPSWVIRIVAGEEADLGGVHVGQGCRANEHVIEDLAVDWCRDA